MSVNAPLRNLALGIIVPAATLLLGGAWLAAGGAAPRPVWLTDLATAEEQARRENKPIFAVLHCGH